MKAGVSPNSGARPSPARVQVHVHVHVHVQGSPKSVIIRNYGWRLMENICGIAKVCRKIDMKSQPNDFAYWQTRSHEERLACLEEIRQEYHGWKNNAEQRLQRVYTIVKR